MFHNCSAYIRDWLLQQPHVKEESLTDWLLFEISQNNPAIYYQAFSRHEESQNGADWEWWILTSDKMSTTYSKYPNAFNAYRFFVQAKKLLSDGGDNYPNLHYGNRNGLQIDLLIENAKLHHAFPLYMYYSATEPELKEQKKNCCFVDGLTLDWCAECLNGCFLSNAYDVYNLLFFNGRKRLIDVEMLNHSYKVSLLDKLFNIPMDSVERLLTIFNNKIVEYLNPGMNHNSYLTQGIYGIKHYGEGIPSYLSLFVERHNKNLAWFESQMRHSLPNVGGVGVIDLRNNNT